MAARDATLPDLQLHDILNNMSPSPSPLQIDLAQNRPRSATPEVLTEADIAQMRHRVIEIRNSSQGLADLTERETELFNMVRRLTESTLVDTSQLIRQAEVISRLTVQRDFLIRQTEEERGRWASQRDEWERMAEALIAQRNKSSSGPTKEDIDRYCAAYESENKTLREKLNDTSSRLQHLEAEITKLRPILLMQPVTTATAISHHTSVLSGIAYPSTQAAAEKAKPKKKKKKEPRVPVVSTNVPDEQESQEPVETQPMEGVEKTTNSSSFFQFQAQPILPPATQPAFTGDHYRKPATAPVGGPLTAPPTTLEFQVSTPALQPPQTARTIRRPSPQPADTNAASAPEPLTPGRPGLIPKKGKRSGPPIPLTSDARTEHLLLAARKIGRQRAGIVAGYVRDRQKELEMQKQERERERMAREIEREKAEKERLERIAERGQGGLSYYRRDVVEAGPSNSGKAPGSTPQTPKKGRRSADASGSGSPPPGSRANTTFVLVEASTKGKGKALEQSQGSGNVPDTPHQQQQSNAPSVQQTQPPTNPSTPLSSLIDAARMIGGSEDTSVQARNGGGGGRGRKNGVNGSSEVHGGGADPGQGRRRGAAAVEQPESPAPKRRRVASARAAAAAAAATTSSSSRNGNGSWSGSGSGPGSRNGNGGEREGMNSAMTALHVLADQAAAFSTHDQRGKGKAREMQDEEAEDDGGEGDADYAPTSIAAGTRKGKTRGRPPAKEKEKSKPKTTTTRKNRGKAVAATPATAPRLISPPTPKSSSGPSINNALHSSNRGRISTTPKSTSLHNDKPPSPARVNSIQGIQGTVGDRTLTSDAPRRPLRGDEEEENLAGALLRLAPPAEIHSRSPLSYSAPKDDVSGTRQDLQSRQSQSVGSKGVEEMVTSRDHHIVDSAHVPASTDVPGTMGVDLTPTIVGTKETGVKDDKPAIKGVLQPDANGVQYKRTGPTSEILGGASHDSASSHLRGEGDFEDDEADAEGEVDAEGELDLEEENPSHMLLDCTITTGGVPSLPVGERGVARLSSQ